MELNVNTEGLPTVLNVTKAEATSFIDDILALLINKTIGGNE